jgi:hypothetical protein
VWWVGVGWLGLVGFVLWRFVGGSLPVRLGFVAGLFGVAGMGVFLCFVGDPGFVSAFPFFGSAAGGRREGLAKGGGVIIRYDGSTRDEKSGRSAPSAIGLNYWFH